MPTNKHPLDLKPSLARRLGPAASKVYRETLRALPHLSESEREPLRNYSLLSAAIQKHELDTINEPLAVTNGDKQVRNPALVSLGSMRRDATQLYKELRKAAAENEAAAKAANAKHRELHPDAAAADDSGLA